MSKGKSLRAPFAVGARILKPCFKIQTKMSRFWTIITQPIKSPKKSPNPGIRSADFWIFILNISWNNHLPPLVYVKLKQKTSQFSKQFTNHHIINNFGHAQWFGRGSIWAKEHFGQKLQKWVFNKLFMFDFCEYYLLGFSNVYNSCHGLKSRPKCPDFEQLSHKLSHHL